ncbi:MAG TPA: ABC transporter permease [Solirubrobacterales bacterium]|nr:ABC transporter permease [Solirubrobacterales bacterium]
MSGRATTPRQGTRDRAMEAIERPDYVPVVDSAGNYASFVAGAVRGLGRVGDYGAEALRQASLIAASSVLILVAISFMAGATCGLEGSAISRALGTGIAAPIFSAFCTTREVVPFIFGFMVAAKIGGGIVAELGSMRVNEEVDALEVMGIPSITYLVSTRMLAAMLMLPIAYLVSLMAAQGASWLASFVRFGDVSQGTWEFAFYTALDPIDVLYSVIKGLVLSFAVVMTALFYGYRVRGGPVEVGVATAQSMATNLVVVTILNMVLTFVFWGFDPNLPIA